MKLEDLALFSGVATQLQHDDLGAQQLFTAVAATTLELAQFDVFFTEPQAQLSQAFQQSVHDVCEEVVNNQFKKDFLTDTFDRLDPKIPTDNQIKKINELGADDIINQGHIVKARLFLVRKIQHELAQRAIEAAAAKFKAQNPLFAEEMQARLSRAVTHLYFDGQNPRDDLISSVMAKDMKVEDLRVMVKADVEAIAEHKVAQAEAAKAVDGADQAVVQPPQLHFGAIIGKMQRAFAQLEVSPDRALQKFEQMAEYLVRQTGVDTSPDGNAGDQINAAVVMLIQEARLMVIEAHAAAVTAADGAEVVKTPDVVMVEALKGVIDAGTLDGIVAAVQQRASERLKANLIADQENHPHQQLQQFFHKADSRKARVGMVNFLGSEAMPKAPETAPAAVAHTYKAQKVKVGKEAGKDVRATATVSRTHTSDVLAEFVLDVAMQREMELHDALQVAQAELASFQDYTPAEDDGGEAALTEEVARLKALDDKRQGALAKIGAAEAEVERIEALVAKGDEAQKAIQALEDSKGDLAAKVQAGEAQKSTLAEKTSAHDTLAGEIAADEKEIKEIRRLTLQADVEKTYGQTAIGLRTKHTKAEKVAREHEQTLVDMRARATELGELNGQGAADRELIAKKDDVEAKLAKHGEGKGAEVTGANAEDTQVALTSTQEAIVAAEGRQARLADLTVTVGSEAAALSDGETELLRLKGVVTDIETEQGELDGQLEAVEAAKEKLVALTAKRDELEAKRATLAILAGERDAADAIVQAGAVAQTELNAIDGKKGPHQAHIDDATAVAVTQDQDMKVPDPDTAPDAVKTIQVTAKEKAERELTALEADRDAIGDGKFAEKEAELKALQSSKSDASARQGDYEAAQRNVGEKTKALAAHQWQMEKGKAPEGEDSPEVQTVLLSVQALAKAYRTKIATAAKSLAGEQLNLAVQEMTKCYLVQASAIQPAVTSVDHMRLVDVLCHETVSYQLDNQGKKGPEAVTDLPFPVSTGLMSDPLDAKGKEALAAMKCVAEEYSNVENAAAVKAANLSVVTICGDGKRTSDSSFTKRLNGMTQAAASPARPRSLSRVTSLPQQQQQQPVAFDEGAAHATLSCTGLAMPGAKKLAPAQQPGRTPSHSSGEHQSTRASGGGRRPSDASSRNGGGSTKESPSKTVTLR